VTAGSSGAGGSRRSGRRSSKPLQHITVGSQAPPDVDDAPEPEDLAGDAGLDLDDDADLDEALVFDEDSELDEDAAPEAPPSSRPHPPGRPTRPRSAAGSGRRSGLDRIRPRSAPVAPDPAPRDVRAPTRPGPPDLGPIARDPLGKAALYSSGRQQSQQAIGTFLVECSECRRETPVTAGDLVRLGLPSFHLPFLKRFPSLMKCPACGRRTWVRVRWRL